jgi:hypothetical protein
VEDASSRSAESALERMRVMLSADGYELDIDAGHGGVRLTVRATAAACEDCLVPKELLASIAVSMLAEVGIVVLPDDVAIRYPAER